MEIQAFITEDPRLLAVLLPLLLLSLTVHEFAHARVALAFGDPTAYRAGRVTMNPLKHLDPVGTLLILFVGFGWAKPVPVNPFLLRPRRLGDIMVSLAGPLSNLTLAIIFGAVLKIWMAAGWPFDTNITEVIFIALFLSMWINLALCTFNLVPLFPLDGHHILREMLPPSRQDGYMRWQMQFGRYLMIALWIGPFMLIRITNNNNIPDPLGYLIGHVQALAHYLIFQV
jgi:Zn-dependent protease